MRVFKISETQLPSGTIPYPHHQACCVETDSYVNSYGGGLHSVEILFNNAVIAERRDCLEKIVMSITYEHPCKGCGETCDFEVSLGCLNQPCEEEPCEASVDCFCGSMKCGGCAGGVICCPPTEEGGAYVVTSIHPGMIFTIDPHLFEDEYQITVLQEATPFYLNPPIPVATAVTQNTSLEYYDPETAHVPTGDLENDVFVGIALAGEMGLLSSEDYRSCCECPAYNPCESVCVLSTGEMVIDLLTPLESQLLQDLEIGFVNDPTVPENGKIVAFEAGSPPPNVTVIDGGKVVKGKYKFKTSNY